MFTKEFILNEIRPAINKALANADLPPGVTVRLGSGSFNEGEVSFKLIATAVSETGIPIMPDLEKKMIAQITGLPESKIQGLKIRIQGKEFTVTGYNGRSYKNPIELRGADGRGAKCPESTLINALRLRPEKSPPRSLESSLPARASTSPSDPDPSVPGLATPGPFLSPSNELP